MIKFFQTTKFWQINQDSKYLNSKKGTFLAYPFLALLIFFSSCEPNNNLGLEVQPTEGQIGVEFTDTLNVAFTQYQIPADSFTIYHAGINAPNLPLGAYNDPIFGLVDAQLVFDFSEGTPLPEEYTLDSAVYVIGIKDLYQFNSGQDSTPTSQPLTFEIYQLTEELASDDTIRADFEVAYDPTPIARLENVTVEINGDSIEFFNKKLGPSLIFKMDQAWAENMMSLQNPQLEPGLLIKVVDPEGLSLDEGSVLNTFPANYTGTEVVFIYNTDEQDSLTRVIYTTDESVYYSKINHDYTGTLAGDALANPHNRNNVFVQAGGGIRTRLKITDLKEFAETTNMVVNKAEIIFPVVENEEYEGVSAFLALKMTENGTLGDAIFYPEPGGVAAQPSGAFYNEDCNCYTLDITLYIQEQVEAFRTGEDENFGFCLIPAVDNQSVNRSLFEGIDNNGNLQLKITYTPVN